MSKNELLTKYEYFDYKPDKRIIEQIETCCKEFNLSPDELNILDWGCGRGRDVLWLRDKGYNAYGVDLDKTPVENAYPLILKKGYSKDILRLLDKDGTTTFDEHYFHLIFSNQVFEHVSDLHIVAAEMQRITAKGGVGHHIFPPHKHIIERHLHMPFLHWLPKSGIRRSFISMFVNLGVEPKWPELDKVSNKYKIDTYYNYSKNKTFYRKPSQIRKIFNKYNFHASFNTVSNTSVTKHKLLRPFTVNKFSRKLVNFLLVTFIRVDLFLKKP